MSDDKPRTQIRIPLPVPEQGLGDVVHRMTAALGIPHCAPCAARKSALNRVIRVGRTKRVNEKA